MIGWIVLAIVVVFMGYVRLAPSDPAIWHQQAHLSGMGGQVFAGGYVWREAVADGDNSQLHQLDQIIMTTSRTTRLVGSIEEKQITYVTRSAVLGFPDYTTVGVYHGLNGTTDQRYFEINGRLRFGQSDLGVNAKRIKGWVADLKAGG